MKFALLLIALLGASQAVKTMKSANKNSGDLKYYHRYEERHGVPEQNQADIPLDDHYREERQLRKNLFNTEEKIKKLEEHVGFALRDLERQKLAFENDEDKVNSEITATNRMEDQRIQALKEDLNHEEKFRELYEARLKKNLEKAHT